VDDLVAALTASGTTVDVVACDLTRSAEVAALLARVPGTAPLTGVIQTTARLDDVSIRELSPDRLTAVVAAKTRPAWHFHALLGDRSDVTTLYCSSIAGLIGGPGQANYAAANAALDALAAHRTALGRPTQSLVWGLWEERSELTAGADLTGLARLGVRPVTPQAGAALFDLALATGQAMAVAVPFDRLAARLSGLADGPLWQILVPPAPTAVANGWRASWEDLDSAERLDRVQSLVLDHTRAVIPGSAPDLDTSFKDLGLQSLGAVELRNRLNQVTGLRLATTLVFNHPTPQAVADHILGQLAPTAPTVSAAGAGLEARTAPMLPAGVDPTTALTALRAHVRRDDLSPAAAKSLRQALQELLATLPQPAASRRHDQIASLDELALLTPSRSVS
jgi:acyl carrier protein